MLAAAVTISSQLVEVSALVGALLPLLVAVVQQTHWPNWLRVVVGVGSSLVAATVTAAAQHKLNLHDWGAAALTVFLMTMSTYRAVWRPAGLAGAIETRTTIRRGRHR